MSCSETPIPSVVLDSNVVLDLWLFNEPGVQPLRQALDQGRLHWIGTEAMLAELAWVLARPFALARQPQAGLLLDGWRTRVRLLPVAPDCGLRCRDPEDQKFIDLAIAAGARWLLSKDRALLDLRRRAARRGLAVLAPAAWSAPTS